MGSQLVVCEGRPGDTGVTSIFSQNNWSFLVYESDFVFK